MTTINDKDIGVNLVLVKHLLIGQKETEKQNVKITMLIFRAFLAKDQKQQQHGVQTIQKKGLLIKLFNQRLETVH